MALIDVTETAFPPQSTDQHDATSTRDDVRVKMLERNGAPMRNVLLPKAPRVTLLS